MPRFPESVFIYPFDILEQIDSSASGEGGESGESRESGESGETESKRSSIPRDEFEDDNNLEDDEFDSVDSALESDDKSEDTSEGDQEGSAEQKASTRGKVITDTMDDIAQAALGNKIERKSDIIHSLPKTSEVSFSGDQQSSEASVNKAIKQKSGAALKNLFTALADGQTSTADSGEDDVVKQKHTSESAKRDNQVSMHILKYK